MSKSPPGREPEPHEFVQSQLLRYEDTCWCDRPSTDSIHQRQELAPPTERHHSEIPLDLSDIGATFDEDPSGAFDHLAGEVNRLLRENRRLALAASPPSRGEPEPFAGRERGRGWPWLTRANCGLS